MEEMWILLLQTGQTFTEHAADLYPIFSYIIIALVTVIGGLVVAYTKENRSAMKELKSGQDTFHKSFNEFVVGNERRLGKFDKRLSIVEDRVGVQVPREYQEES